MMFSTETKLRAEIEQVGMILTAERVTIAAQAERIRVLREALEKIAQFDSYEPAGPAANTARAALEATK